MNRIKLSPLATAFSETDSHPPQETQTRPTSLFSLDPAPRQTDQETSVFVPMHYERNYAYPLVIWLHSDGQTSGQLQSLMELLSMRNYVGVAPQASVGNFQCGYFWEQDYDSIHAANQAIADCIEYAKARFNINPKRIFLAGSGGGGTMAFRIGLQNPNQFAGIISLNGALPIDHSPLSQWARCRQMPIFWSHHVDPSEPENAALMCENFQFLYACGFLNMTAREYPSMRYLEELAPAAVDQWIMEQIDSAVR